MAKAKRTRVFMESIVIGVDDVKGKSEFAGIQVWVYGEFA